MDVKKLAYRLTPTQIKKEINLEKEKKEGKNLERKKKRKFFTRAHAGAYMGVFA